jgi:hypothetical protein
MFRCMKFLDAFVICCLDCYRDNFFSMEGLFFSVMELVCFLEYLLMTCMIGRTCEIIDMFFLCMLAVERNRALGIFGTTSTLCAWHLV